MINELQYHFIEMYPYNNKKYQCEIPKKMKFGYGIYITYMIYISANFISDVIL